MLEGDRIGAEQEAETASAGGLSVVIFPGQVRERLRKFLGKGCALGSVGEADVGFNGERGEAFAGLVGAATEHGDVPDGARRGGDKVVAGELISYVRGVSVAEQERRDDVGTGGGADQALHAVSLPPLFDEFHEAVLFEFAQVVVHLLPGQGKLASQTRRRIGLMEVLKKLLALRRKERFGDGGGLDHF